MTEVQRDVFPIPFFSCQAESSRSKASYDRVLESLDAVRAQRTLGNFTKCERCEQRGRAHTTCEVCGDRRRTATFRDQGKLGVPLASGLMSATGRRIWSRLV